MASNRTNYSEIRNISQDYDVDIDDLVAILSIVDDKLAKDEADESIRRKVSSKSR